MIFHPSIMDLQPIQVPRALMDILMFEHGVHYGQTVICTKKNFTKFRFRWSKPFLQITPVLSLKSPSRTMESPDGASPSTWAPWTKAWPPGAFHQVLGSRPISGRVHRSLALLACHWSIESLVVCLLTQDQFTLGDPSSRQRDRWGTQSAPPCQGGDSQRGQQQHGFHFVNYHLHWSNQFNRSFPLAYPYLLRVNKMINQTALLPNKRVPWFLCQIWLSLVTLGYRKSQKTGAALVHCGWANNYYAGNLQEPGFDSWIISKLFDFPFCFLKCSYKNVQKII